MPLGIDKDMAEIPPLFSTMASKCGCPKTSVGSLAISKPDLGYIRIRLAKGSDDQRFPEESSITCDGAPIKYRFPSISSVPIDREGI